MSTNLPCTVVKGIRCYSPEVASLYEDYPEGGFDLTDKSGESSFWVRSRNRLFKNIVNDHLVATGITRFLEIGCGTGGFIRQIVENPNLEITGSEIYLKGLLYAKKDLPDVDFIQFDVTQGTIGEEFDVIVAFDVLEHIGDDVASLSNIHAMLRMEGCLIITVPQHMFLWSRLDEIVKHKRRYSRQELTAKLQKTGFDISFCTSFLFVLFPLMVVSRIFDRWCDQAEPDEVAFEKKVTFSTALNWILDKLMRIDEALIRRCVSLSFGGTLVVVARKS